MRLLLDQNISFRLVKKISSVYEVVQQVRLLELENASDIDIWHYAKKNNFAIVLLMLILLILPQYLVILRKLFG